MPALLPPPVRHAATRSRPRPGRGSLAGTGRRSKRSESSCLATAVVSRVRGRGRAMEPRSQTPGPLSGRLVVELAGDLGCRARGAVRCCCSAPSGAFGGDGAASHFAILHRWHRIRHAGTVDQWTVDPNSANPREADPQQQARPRHAHVVQRPSEPGVARQRNSSRGPLSKALIPDSHADARPVTSFAKRALDLPCCADWLACC